MSNRPLAGIYFERVAMKLVVINRLLIKSLGLLFAVGTLLPTVAQAPSDVRIALVIGNAAYPGAAALVNPGNDAKAMSETLRGLGFTVVEARDASRAQIVQAIATVRDNLKGRSGTGMLYYAGHGLQLDWRNYMVPVDARLTKAADVPEQAVDLGQVIDAFKVAGNKMNIVVLDACRDNPFAGTATGKGLAQLDAPPGTFLAYATAPGNVAEDGETKADSNGLYTKYLLQELKKPQAKIEDVFKRVRLNVRQQSQGRQIPWESTSLEDDFFFNAGLKPTQKLSDSEKDRAFTTEKVDWDKIAGSKSVDDFYAFLQKYPNGNVSGLAQTRIEVLQKAKTTVVADQSGLKQGSMIDSFINGDKYVLELRDGYSNAIRGKGTVQIFSRADDLIEGVSDNPSLIGGAELNRGGFIRRDGGGSYDPPYGLFPNGELKIGTQATTRSNVTHNNGYKQWVDIQSKVTGREVLDTALGKINTIRVDVVLQYQNGNRSNRTLWYDPEWGYAIRLKIENRSARGGSPDLAIREMISRERGRG
jgi:Caspase domain